MKQLIFALAIAGALILDIQTYSSLVEAKRDIDNLKLKLVAIELVTGIQ